MPFPASGKRGCAFSQKRRRASASASRALADLPLLAAALARGELSYAKVRAFTRVATPETEAQQGLDLNPTSLRATDGTRLNLGYALDVLHPLSNRDPPRKPDTPPSAGTAPSDDETPADDPPGS